MGQMNGLQEAWGGVRQALDAAGAVFAIGGSWASTAYGEPRQTNDIDLIAGFTQETLGRFLDSLGSEYYVDAETAIRAMSLNRPFNLIHRQLAYKFDLFPVKDEYGLVELDRRRMVSIAGLDQAPVPVVSAEDVVLAKLRWYRQGGGVSLQQWRDVLGVLRGEAEALDREYLDRWAARLGLVDVYKKAKLEVGG